MRRDDGWRRYVPVARRRQRAARMAEELRRQHRKLAPIAIQGRRITTTFWGSAWCDNLEAYSDFSNRLPRGRTYVRNGSVIDLKITGGRVLALVNGSELYKVKLDIRPLAPARWKRIRSRCAGRIDSLVELLQGHISKGVMDIVTRIDGGLFPSPREISLQCSCPDWAVMCKHVAATLYGVGSRLDHAPEMLFALRGVDPTEMVSDAAGQIPGKRRKAGRRVLAERDLSSVFGVDIERDDGGGGKTATRARPGTRGRTEARSRGRTRTSTRTTKKPSPAPRPRKAATGKKRSGRKAAKGTPRKAAARKGRRKAPASPRVGRGRDRS